MNTLEKAKIDRDFKAKLASEFSKIEVQASDSTTTFYEEVLIDGEYLSIEGEIYTNEYNAFKGDFFTPASSDYNHTIGEVEIIYLEETIEGQDLETIAQLFINNVNIA